MDFGAPTKTGEENVLSHLGRLLDDQIKTDVEFIVKGHKVGGHQLILQGHPSKAGFSLFIKTALIRPKSNFLSAGGSPVFAAMFEHEMVESVTRTVTIEDTEPKVFSQLLRYLYTGDAPEIEGSEMTEPLFIAADKYQVESLKVLILTKVTLSAIKCL